MIHYKRFLCLNSKQFDVYQPEALFKESEHFKIIFKLVKKVESFCFQDVGGQIVYS